MYCFVLFTKQYVVVDVDIETKNTVYYHLEKSRGFMLCSRLRQSGL